MTLTEAGTPAAPAGPQGEKRSRRGTFDASGSRVAAPREQRRGLWARFNSIEVTPKKLPRKDLMHLSRQLAVFVRAGVPLVEALTTIRDETEHRFVRQVLSDVLDGLQHGLTLTQAVDLHREAFPPYYVGMLGSAELTGRLDEVLLRLADYIERDVEARRRISSAVTYPAIIAVMAVGVVTVLTVYVLPKFEGFFASFGARLPLPTRILLTASHDLRVYWFAPAGAGLLLLVLAWCAFRTERGRYARDRVLLRTPVVRDLVVHAVVERFCRVLSAMVGSGVTMLDALTVCSEAISNRVYRRGLQQVREALLRGEGLARPLAETGLFPATTRQMLRVGEETGSLDEQLVIAAEFYDRELDHQIKRFTGLFEPAVIVGMGLVVGFVALALVTAMYGIYRQVQT